MGVWPNWKLVHLAALKAVALESSSLSARAKHRKMNLVNYIKDSFEELRNNVTWISWEEAQKSTVVVAVFTIIFALAVFLVDKIFQTGLTEYFKLF